MKNNVFAATTVSAALMALVAPALADAQADVQEAAPVEYKRVEKLLDTDKTILDQQIVYPAGDANVTAVVVTLQPGEETGQHMHAVPLFGYILEGELQITYDGGVEETFKTGDALMEGLYRWHNGKVVGDQPVRVLAVFMGSKDLPAVVRP